MVLTQLLWKFQQRERSEGLESAGRFKPKLFKIRWNCGDWRGASFDLERKGNTSPGMGRLTPLHGRSPFLLVWMFTNLNHIWLNIWDSGSRWWVVANEELRKGRLNQWCSHGRQTKLNIAGVKRKPVTANRRGTAQPSKAQGSSLLRRWGHKQFLQLNCVPILARLGRKVRSWCSLKGVIYLLKRIPRA